MSYILHHVTKSLSRILIITVFICKSVAGYSQDSFALLVNNARNNPHFPNRLSNYFHILHNEKIPKTHTDSLPYYILEYHSLAKHNNIDTAILWANYFMLVAEKRKGNFDVALDICQENYLKPSYSSHPLLYNSYRIEYQDIYYRMSSFNKAIKVANEFLEHSIKHRDTAMMIYTMSDIACNLDGLGNAKESKQQFLKADALSINPKYNHVKSECALYLNLSSIYLTEHKNDSALYYAQKSIDIQEANNKTVSPIHYVLKAKALLDTQPVQAINILHKAKDAYLQSKNYYFYIYAMAELATMYNSLSRHDDAISVCHEAYAIWKIHPAITQDYILNPLVKAYLAKKDLHHYSIYMDSLMNVKKEIFQSNSARELALLRVMYDIGQKENQILEQKQNIQSQRFIYYLSITIFLGILISGIIYFIAYKRRIKMLRHVAHMKQLHETEMSIKDAKDLERKRIASDLHDNLGVQATMIIHNAEQLQIMDNQNNHKIKVLRDSASDMLFFLRETLWALKDNDTSIQAVWFRVINLIKKVKTAVPHIDFQVNTEELMDRKINSGQALNIMMIVQEAINNAIKHSECDTLKVYSMLHDNEWTIYVEDYGKGIEDLDNAIHAEANGLINITQRAKSHNLRLSIESKKGQGTVIKVGVTIEKVEGKMM